MKIILTTENQKTYKIHLPLWILKKIIFKNLSKKTAKEINKALKAYVAINGNLEVLKLEDKSGEKINFII